MTRQGSGVKVFRYPVKTLVGDYVRAAVGLAVGIGVLLSVPPSPAIVIVFGGLSVLFLVFAVRTVHRQIVEIGVSGEAICAAGLRTRVVAWNDLDRVKLRYYGTRRQRQHQEGSGFMQLTLADGRESVTLESSLQGFDYVAWRAAKAARENGVSLDPTSAGNLLHLGLDADVDGPPPETP